MEQDRKVVGKSFASVAGTDHVRTDFPGDVSHQSESRLDNAFGRSAGDFVVDASGLCQTQMDAGIVSGDAFGDWRFSVERMAVGLARSFSVDRHGDKADQRLSSSDLFVVESAGDEFYRDLDLLYVSIGNLVRILYGS